MILRPAAFGDIPLLVDLFSEAHAASRLADLPLDRGALRELLMGGIQRHGGKGDGACFVEVACRNLVVVGFIFGVLQRAYHVSDRLEAQDLFWVCRPKAPARAAVALLDDFHAWALSNPRVAYIRQATTDLIPGRDAAPLLARKGMVERGRVFEKAQT